MESNLARPFYKNYKKNGSNIALFVDDTYYTYHTLGELAGSIANYLQARHKEKTIERVGIFTGKSLTAYAGILGVCWAGMTFVPLNPKNSEYRLESMFRQAKLDVLIIDKTGYKALKGKLLEASPSLIMVPFMNDKEIDSSHTFIVGLDISGSLKIPEKVNSNNPAYILFTSGTTGEPKGVMVSRQNVAHFISVSQERYQIEADDRLSQFSEITFDHIIFDLFMTWNVGASLHVVPINKVMAPINFINTQKLTIWFSVPSVISFVKEMKLLKKGVMPSLRLSLFAGEPLSMELAGAWQRASPSSRIDNLYGPTEATVDCLWYPFDEVDEVTQAWEVLAIGKPYKDMHAAIINSSKKFLPAGERGELAISGPQVSPGYWQNPELTETKFPILSHPEFGKSTWYLTGDLAYQDLAGLFHYLGRVDNQVKILGQRVELEDIESHLREICNQDLVAVVAWPIVNGSPQGLMAFVAGVSRDKKELKKELKKRLPPYMVPKNITFLSLLPLNINGKIDRKALVNLLEKG